MEARKNLCAMIPTELHNQVRAEQEAMGIRLSDYVEQILREHFEGGKPMEAATRTLALQISEDLFRRMKEYLSKNHLTQKQFIIDLIEQALAEAKE